MVVVLDMSTYQMMVILSIILIVGDKGHKKQAFTKADNCGTWFTVFHHQKRYEVNFYRLSQTQTCMVLERILSTNFKSNPCFSGIYLKKLNFSLKNVAYKIITFTGRYHLRHANGSAQQFPWWKQTCLYPDGCIEVSTHRYPLVVLLH